MIKQDPLRNLNEKKEIWSMGVHCASRVISLALVRDQELVFEENFMDDRRWTENLVFQLEALCQRAQLSLLDLHVLSVIQGPGGYTGVRLSVTVTKTMAQVVSGLSIYGFNTLESFIWPFRFQNGTYIALLPARKGEYNAALYGCNHGRVSRLSSDFIWKEDVLKDKVQKMKGRFCIVGEFSEDLKSYFVKNHCQFQKATLLARDIAFRGRDLFVHAKKGDYQLINPVYSCPPVGSRIEK